MAVSGTYYLDAPSLASATSVFDDALLTTLAADGYYAEGVIVRQQVGGILLPQQLCPAYIGFSASVSAVSSEAACLLSETETYYSLSGVVNLGDTIYVDSCGLTTLEEGFYHAEEATSGSNDWFQVDSSGVVIDKGACSTPNIFRISAGNFIGTGGTCSLLLATTLYSTAPSVAASLGYTMYTDAAMTVPFVGIDTDEYAMEWDGQIGTLRIVTISISGVVTSVSNCY